MANKYGRIKSRFLFDDKSTPFSTNFFKGLKGAENVYTQHQPLITKELLPDLVKGKQRADLNYLRQPDATPKVIVFIIGGVTYEETRAVSLYNKENASNVVIGGTSILNYDSFMQSVRDACISQEQQQL
jgi:vacuolar protein sorting-associated protein 45